MFKPKYLLLLLSLAALPAAAQRLDEAVLVCSYDFRWSRDTVTLEKWGEDRIMLLVGPSVSLSYSYYTHAADTAAGAPGANVAAMAAGQAPKYTRRSEWYVYKNWPQGKMTVTENIATDYFRYTDELRSQQWTMAPDGDTCRIAGYLCRRAECEWRGRRWRAWFAPELAVSDGPWKLGGLPGLILRAEDERGHYTFMLTGLERGAGRTIEFIRPRGYMSGGTWQDTDRRKLAAARLRYLTNMARYLNLRYAAVTEQGEELNFDFLKGEDTPPRYDFAERDYAGE